MNKKMHCSKLNKKNRGAALVFVIIIIAIVIIFTFSLLLVTYNLYAMQSKKAASLRCSEAANSLSIALEKELTDDDAYENSWFWKYLRYNMMQEETWPYYNPGISGHTEEYAFRYFDVKANTNYGIDGFPGEVKLCVYWELPNEFSVPEGKTITDLTRDEKNDFFVTIEIMCNTGNQSYTVTNKYRVEVSEFSSEDDDEKSLLDSESGDSDYNPLNISDTKYKANEKWRFFFESRE